MICPSCGARNSESARSCQGCGAPLIASHSGEKQDAAEAAFKPPMPMNWHNVLTRLILWLGVITNISSGVQTFVGIFSDTIYGEDTAAIYEYYTQLRAIDVTLGLVIFGLAILEGVTAIRLVMRKKGAPTLLTAVLVANALITPLFRSVAMFSCWEKLLATGSEIVVFDTPVIVRCVVIAALLVVNTVYYGKRKHLFIH